MSVNIKYKNNSIATLTDTGTKTLKTSGKYCEGDIVVENVQDGGSAPSAKWNDVTFIDYDGSVLYSYSLEEAQALTELPAFPTHDGLVCRGWNWTLDAIKVLNRPVTVGAMYITDDGATRLHIRIATIGRMTVPLYIGQTVANGVSIDWGDGSTAETLAGTGNVNTSHTYAEPGDYVISLMPEDGCTLSFGSNSDSYCVMGSIEKNDIVYCNMLQDVQVGTGVTSIGDYAFQGCYSLASVTIPDSVTSIGANAFSYYASLTSVTIPNSVTSIGDSAFEGCASLTSVTIPNSVTSIGSQTFMGCSSLTSVTIPNSVTSIGDSAFEGCASLTSVTIPDSVTSIGNAAFAECKSLAPITIPDSVTRIGYSAFLGCYGMAEYHLKPATPPTLSNTNAFLYMPSDCVIYVPAGCLESYQTATNWDKYADKMREETIK